MMRGRTEEEREEEERRKRAEHSEHGHPEISDEALPEERELMVFRCWIEVEEEGTEGELEKKTKVK